jgi:hypothetical protein
MAGCSMAGVVHCGSDLDAFRRLIREADASRLQAYPYLPHFIPPPTPEPFPVFIADARLQDLKS